MKAKVEVTYKMPKDHPKMLIIDSEIKELMRTINAKWYAQGYNYDSELRDLTFDLDLENK